MNPLVREFWRRETLTRKILLVGAICVALFFGTAYVAFENEKTLCKPIRTEVVPKAIVSEPLHGLPEPKKVVGEERYHLDEETLVSEASHPTSCKIACRRLGTETLPRDIVQETSNLEIESLRSSLRIKEQEREEPLKSILAIPVGVKQKDIVDRIVAKFPSANFTLMLFHYDGAVDEWGDLDWSDRAIHVSALSQTKWWFAKRFLHPDIVAEYEYIFLWDEDIEVENFHALRYIDIVKSEGLEISQPALGQNGIHHAITVRRRNRNVHRRAYKLKSGRCNENSTAPPCAGWVEMMAPVFSRAAWRCVWHMIQNDLVYAWGLDYKLGYCAQGDRTLNVGVVDSEYIVHMGIPTLGGNDSSRVSSGRPGSEDNKRMKVRQRSYDEMKIFKMRWDDAVKKDTCWVDPYGGRNDPTSKM